MKKLNDMCKNCRLLYTGECKGSHDEVYTGCVYKDVPKSEIIHNDTVFKLAMIIPGFIYYADMEESDENANTVLMDVKTERIASDNYFASNEMILDLEKIHNGKIESYYMSNEMKENYDLICESGYFDE